MDSEQSLKSDEPVAGHWPVVRFAPRHALLAPASLSTHRSPSPNSAFIASSNHPQTTGPLSHRHAQSLTESQPGDRCRCCFSPFSDPSISPSASPTGRSTSPATNTLCTAALSTLSVPTSSLKTGPAAVNLVQTSVYRYPGDESSSGDRSRLGHQ